MKKGQIRLDGVQTNIFLQWTQPETNIFKKRVIFFNLDQTAQLKGNQLLTRLSQLGSGTDWSDQKCPILLMKNIDKVLIYGLEPTNISIKILTKHKLARHFGPRPIHDLNFIWTLLGPDFTVGRIWRQTIFPYII